MASSLSEMAISQRVAERGSFAGAAEDAGLSPSAVAKLITRLEQRLGVRLINRTTRHLALTAEGELYLDRVREKSSARWRRRSRRSHRRVPRRADICGCTRFPSSPRTTLCRHCPTSWRAIPTSPSISW